MRFDRPLFFFLLVTRQVAALKSSQKLDDSCPGNNSAGRRSFVPTGKNWRDTNCTCSTYINHSWPPDYRVPPLSVAMDPSPSDVIAACVLHVYMHARVRTSIRASHPLAELNGTIPNGRRSHRGELRKTSPHHCPLSLWASNAIPRCPNRTGGVGVTLSRTISINRRRATTRESV